MKYPIDGILFEEIKNDRLIKVDAGNNLKDQRFKIVRIIKSAKDLVTIYAEHISYLTQDLALEPEVEYSGNATTALNTWINNIVDDHPFTIYSDIQTTGSGTWVINEVENARRALGGVQGSILDSYGGEYRFDNYHIGLYAQRGNDLGALIAYGKNLTDLEQEEEIASTYTSIYPYTSITDSDGEDELLTLPEIFIDSEYVDNYARRKILTVDFSSEEIETIEELRARTERYITDNDVGVPKVNLRVKFVDLSRTLDYKDLQLVEEINLCDLVTVYFEKLDIMQKAKVIKTVWDVLLDRYDSIEIGETRSSLSDSVNTIVDGRVDKIEERINTIQIAANGKNKIFRGLDEPMTDMSENDLWYKPVGDGEIEMYVYTNGYWKLEAYSADALGGTINAANVNIINMNAANIVTGTLKGINITGSLITGSRLVASNGNVEFDLDNSRLEMKGSGNNRLIFDDSGIASYDDNNRIRFRLAIRPLGGSGQADPSTLLFYAANTSQSASIGLNVNGTFVVGSEASGVGLEIRSRNYNIHYANRHRFTTTGMSDNLYFEILSASRPDNTLNHPALGGSSDNIGYVGYPGRRLHWIQTNYLRYNDIQNTSSRKYKSDIKDLDIEEMNDVFGKIRLKTFKYLDNEETSLGMISEEAPEVIVTADREAINMGSYINVIAAALKHQIKRIDELERRLA